MNSSYDPNDMTMTAIDGRDALAYVILRPGPSNAQVVAEAGAKGITKGQAAAALRMIADKWDAEEARQTGEQS